MRRMVWDGKFAYYDRGARGILGSGGSCVVSTQRCGYHPATTRKSDCGTVARALNSDLPQLARDRVDEAPTTAPRVAVKAFGSENAAEGL